MLAMHQRVKLASTSVSVIEIGQTLAIRLDFREEGE